MQCPESLAQDPPQNRRANTGGSSPLLPGRRFALQICREGRSLGAISAMHRSCPTCSARSRQARRSAASLRPLSGHRVAMPCRAVDGAYDTRKCHDAIADRGARAVISPRKKAKPWKTVTAGAVARNEALRASKYLGRAIWRNWSGYHRRSRVETNPLGIMRCKTLPGSGCTA
jgi:hypothetical protein